MVVWVWLLFVCFVWVFLCVDYWFTYCILRFVRLMVGLVMVCFV